MNNICFSSRQKEGIARRISRGIINLFPEKNRQKRFAERLGVSTGTIQRWTTGKTTPRLEQLAVISEVLNIPLHKLCGFSGRRLVKTSNIVFDNIMNLSIVVEQATVATNGIGRATGGTMKKIEGRLGGLTKHTDSKLVK